jgi:hypothetical protein
MAVLLKSLKRFVVVGGLLLFGGIVGAQAQVPSDAKKAEAANPAMLAELTARRDAFVKATAASGLPCEIAPPELVLMDTPSYGNYEPEKNTLRTPLWEMLKPEEKRIFFRLAGPKASEAAAKHEFEIGAHHWVFIHEMGHWWQACRKVNDGRKPYSFEYEADRIDAAYWRDADPTVDEHMRAKFQGLVDGAPNPVPVGQEPEAYFNENYERLGPTPAYIWFQSQMCVKVFAEMPPPSFMQTLRETGKA